MYADSWGEGGRATLEPFYSHLRNQGQMVHVTPVFEIKLAWWVRTRTALSPLAAALRL